MSFMISFGCSALRAESIRTPFQPLLSGVEFANWNDLSHVKSLMGDDVCSVIVEPVQGESGISSASKEFLRFAFHCTQHKLANTCALHTCAIIHFN